MPPDKKTIAQKKIQFDLPSYQSFYDHTWSGTTLDDVKGSRLEDAVTRISQMARSFRHGVCAFSPQNPAFPTTSC